MPDPSPHSRVRTPLSILAAVVDFEKTRHRVDGDTGLSAREIELAEGALRELEGRPEPWRLYKRLTELEEQLEALRFEAIKAAAQLPEDPYRALETLKAALDSNPAKERE